MTSTTLFAFAFVALVTAGTPGPTVLLALSNGSRHGLRLALVGVLGALLSDALLIGAVALGLGALLAASEAAFVTLKWLGVAYLAWLGVGLLRSRGAAAAVAGADIAAAPAARAVFSKSLLVALSNPKGILFFSALLPQFVVPEAPLLPQYSTLAALFMAIDAAVMLGYALLGARAAQWLRGAAAAWLDRCCGACLLALAGTLAAYRRS